MNLSSSVNRTRLTRALALVFVFSVACCGKSFAATDWNPIENQLKTTGTQLPGNVLRFELVRQDLAVNPGNGVLPANQVGVIANGYVAFKAKANGNAFVAGSLPALESEVEIVQDQLRRNSHIKITAVVNHDIGETPKLIWVHFQGSGSGVDLASTIENALSSIHSPQLNVNVISGTNTVIDPSVLPENFMKLFDEGTIEQVTDFFVFYLPRPDEKRFFIGDTPAEVGLGVGQSFYIKIDFSGGTTATLNVELALRKDELQPVMDALRDSPFHVSSVNTHFVNSDPDLFYVDASGTGDGFTLGTTLYNVIQIINGKK
jgi:hypothetical protein